MADVRRAVREWAVEHAQAPTRYLVALSGGGDSLALAWALSHEAPALGFSVGAVVVDHQLQEGSGERAQHAAEVASSWGLGPVIIKKVSVGVAGGPEEAARTVRYQAFFEAMKETGAGGILLAHTRDDQAETVLLGLTRGSGPSALKGMPEVEGFSHRPLLSLARSTLRQALTDAGVSWWDDPHNTDDRFTRSRVRQRVMPVLEEELGPGVAESLARTAALFRRDSEALDGFALSVFDEHVDASTPQVCSIEVTHLIEQNPAVASRVVRSMVICVGGGAPNFAQMQQVEGLLTRWKGQSAIDLSGASLERRDGLLVARSSEGKKPRGTRRGL